MLFMLFWFSKFVKLDLIEKILYWVFVLKWFITFHLQLNCVLWLYGNVLLLEFLIYSLGFVENPMGGISLKILRWMGCMIDFNRHMNQQWNWFVQFTLIYYCNDSLETSIFMVCKWWILDLCNEMVVKWFVLLPSFFFVFWQYTHTLHFNPQVPNFL